VGGVQSAAKSEPSPLAIRRSPFAHTPPANLPLVNPQTSTTRTITFSYDRSGRLASANYGDGVLLVYDYDPAGNLQRVTDHFDVFLPLVAR
jgi:YD repeat-containing protein